MNYSSGKVKKERRPWANNAALVFLNTATNQQQCLHFQKGISFSIAAKMHRIEINQHFYRVFQNIENIFVLLNQAFNTCEYNLSSYIYVNKRINSYLLKNGHWLYTETIEETKKMQISPKKIEKYKTTKTYVSSEFCSEKNHNKQIFAIFAPT